MFLIAVDLSDPTLDFQRLKSFIRDSDIFQNWWNHIPGVFLVTSTRSVETVSDEMKSMVGSARYLVMEANPAESEGWLPEQAWRWISRRERREANEAAEQVAAR
jgi:hypothetical protein